MRIANSDFIIYTPNYFSTEYLPKLEKMDLKLSFFASSLMLVLVICSAQSPTPPPDAPEVTDVPTGTDLATDSNMTTAQEPDTNAADNSSTQAPQTMAPSTNASAKPPTKAPTEAPATDTPKTKQPTESPVIGTTDKASNGGSNKGFSAGSFFGGIILAVAVLGIGFCGFKFYQSRQDKNYQTL